MKHRCRMPQSLAMTALLVNSYDEAISFFVGRLGFTLRQDTKLGEGKRWVVVAPPGGTGGLLLAEAVGQRQRSAVGDQGGGRVFLFLETDDFFRDYLAYTERGVRFVEPPRREPYGIVAVFEDLYGNRWDLIEPAAAPHRQHHV
jgi:catechol 2,3-dioxygenase-like lactoylglutathione lyase family enzyme